MLIVCDTDAVDTAPAAGDADMFDISRLCSGACLLACLLNISCVSETRRNCYVNE